MKNSNELSETDNERRRCSGALIRWAKVDPQREYTIFDRRDRIRDDRKILVVQLRLGDELLSLVACYGRQRALLHSDGAIPKSLDHRIGVERCHGLTLLP